MDKVDGALGRGDLGVGPETEIFGADATFGYDGPVSPRMGLHERQGRGEGRVGEEKGDDERRLNDDRTEPARGHRAQVDKVPVCHAALVGRVLAHGRSPDAVLSLAKKRGRAVSWEARTGRHGRRGSSHLERRLADHQRLKHLDALDAALCFILGGKKRADGGRVERKELCSSGRGRVVRRREGGREGGKGVCARSRSKQRRGRRDGRW